MDIKTIRRLISLTYSLIKLLLDEEDWECIRSLLDILQPLKEVTLLSSRCSGSLCVAEILPLYSFCTEMLTEEMQRFSKNDDIYSGIQCAVDKLNHYYDKISPMVGIALILNPSMKKDFLRNSLSWKDEWVNDVLCQFTSSFNYYTGRVMNAPEPIAALDEPLGQMSAFAKYRKRKRTVNAPAEDEFIRLLIRDNILDIPMHHWPMTTLTYWSFGNPIDSTTLS